jgi:hypothetical protein
MLTFVSKLWTKTLCKKGDVRQAGGRDHLPQMRIGTKIEYLPCQRWLVAGSTEFKRASQASYRRRLVKKDW